MTTQEKQDWIRYRFYSNEDDCRPVKVHPSYPWWCTGYTGDDSYSTIVAYLPKTEKLEDYWPEAYQVDKEPCDGPSFSDRFPRPKNYTPLKT